jgi:DNA repair protein RecO (recombination protein O)
MPSLVRDRCICLRKFDYSETSQILTLLGRERGMLRVIAKGAKRTTKAGASKFGGGVDLLDLGEAVFTDCPERELATLTEWTLLDGHLDLRKSLRGMYLALYAAELVTMLIEEHDPHVELFDRLEQTLCDLQSPKIEEAFVTFELDLLRETGYLPELSSCALCGNEVDEFNGAAFFSPMRGGALCRNCEGVTPDRIETDPRLLRLTQTLLKLPRNNGSAQHLPRLTRHQSDPINRIVADHVEHTLSRRLRLTPYVLARALAPSPIGRGPG